MLRRTAAGLVGILCLLTGCADSSSPTLSPMLPACQINPADPPSGNRPSAVPNQQELDDIATEIRRLGEREFSAYYTSVAIDTDADRIDVWSKESPEFMAAISNAPWGDRVCVHPAAHSASELNPTLLRIVNDYDYWQKRGLPVAKAGVRQDGSCIDVGTPEPDRAAMEFRKRYPLAPLCFAAREDTGNSFREPRD